MLSSPGFRQYTMRFVSEPPSTTCTPLLGIVLAVGGGVEAGYNRLMTTDALFDCTRYLFGGHAYSHEVPQP